jgi:hypothetical protein
LRGFLESEVEQHIDVLCGHLGGVDIAKPAKKRKGFSGSGEGVVHGASVQTFFSHDVLHNGMAVRRL